MFIRLLRLWVKATCIFQKWLIRLLMYNFLYPAFYFARYHLISRWTEFLWWQASCAVWLILGTQRQHHSQSFMCVGILWTQAHIHACPWFISTTVIKCNQSDLSVCCLVYSLVHHQAGAYSSHYGRRARLCCLLFRPHDAAWLFPLSCKKQLNKPAQLSHTEFFIVLKGDKSFKYLHAAMCPLKDTKQMVGNAHCVSPFLCFGVFLLPVAKHRWKHLSDCTLFSEKPCKAWRI